MDPQDPILVRVREVVAKSLPAFIQALVDEEFPDRDDGGALVVTTALQDLAGGLVLAGMQPEDVIELTRAACSAAAAIPPPDQLMFPWGAPRGQS